KAFPEPSVPGGSRTLSPSALAGGVPTNGTLARDRRVSEADPCHVERHGRAAGAAHHEQGSGWASNPRLQQRCWRSFLLSYRIDLDRIDWTDGTRTRFLLDHNQASRLLRLRSTYDFIPDRVRRRSRG